MPDFMTKYQGKSIPSHNIYNIKLIKELLPNGKGLHILDAGCCFGHVTKAIADLGHDVIGIDVNSEYIKTAIINYPDIRFEVMSVMESLDIIAPRCGFDVVITTEVIEHLYAPQRFLTNIHKCLRPGGILLVGTPYHGYLKNLAIAVINGFDKHFMVHEEGGHTKFFSLRTLREMLLQTGYKPDRFMCAGRVPFLWRGMMYRAQRL